MRKYTLLVFIVISIATSAQKTGYGSHSKPSPERLAEIQSKKIAFFSEKMELTPAEAEVFWPIYNEFSKKKMALEKEKHQTYDTFKSNEEKALSDADATKATDNYVALSMQEALLSQEYHNKFKAILPPQKVLKMYAAEHQFNRVLIRMIRQGNKSPESSPTP